MCSSRARSTSKAVNPMTEREIREALHTVVDPELGVNIVDLGLVYEIAIRDGSVSVTMAMTSPMCPLGDYLTELAESAIWTRVPNVKHVQITIVQDPPWDPALMSEEARRQLGGGTA
jgi:metal-sulfur cluster biosynthetic enzyme